MTAEVPLRSACSDAIADIKLQSMKNKSGQTRGYFYSAAVPKTCAPGDTPRGRGFTSISIPPLFAGALRIAADGDMPTVNAALVRAKQLATDCEDNRAVSCLVRSLALAMLRCGWRPHLHDAALRAIEGSAQFDPDVESVVYIDDEDLAHAEANNAQWA